MNLETAQRHEWGECFACRWAGRKIVLWGEEPVDQPKEIISDDLRMDSIKRLSFREYEPGTWRAFVRVNEELHYTVPPESMSPTSSGYQMTLRTGRRTIRLCHKHWWELAHWWQYYAWEEVALNYIFDQWIEKVER